MVQLCLSAGYTIDELLAYMLGHAAIIIIGLTLYSLTQY